LAGFRKSDAGTKTLSRLLLAFPTETCLVRSGMG
jgi:hypothetical protein